MSEAPRRAAAPVKRRRWIIPVIAAGIAVALAVGAFGYFQPGDRSLASVAPELAADLGDGANSLEQTIAAVRETYQAVTGTDCTSCGLPASATDTATPDPAAEDAATVTDGDYQTLLLTTAHPSVAALQEYTGGAQTILDWAQVYLDPEITAIRRKPQVTHTATSGVAQSTQELTNATPEQIPPSKVTQLTTSESFVRELLDKIAAATETGTQHNTAAQDALAEARKSKAVDAQSAVVTELQSLLVEAQALVDYSSAATIGGTPRTALTGAIDTANQALDLATNLPESATATEVAEATTQMQSAYDSMRPVVYNGRNGRLDPSTLCTVPYDTRQLLRCDSVEPWLRLSAAFKEVFGEEIPLDLTYRTFAVQVITKQQQGSWAATPGTSNHGWGIAIDLPDYRESELGQEYNFGTPKYEWLLANAPTYSWNNPTWARVDGSGPREPWHFEFVG